MGQDQAWASGRGSDNAVGPHQELARRFIEGSGKLAGNKPGNLQKKTLRLTARMSEAAGFAGGLVFTQRRSVVDVVVP
ncbi:hypothetical protein BHE74_00023553 [Ensete ventricosum]|nr:hypothetical protein BHE74_00049666 [Ensete ventricosum]RWW68903.1 hypothetical protein BHE74_00023553 [Ensete ventricosum]